MPRSRILFGGTVLIVLIVLTALLVIPFSPVHTISAHSSNAAPLPVTGNVPVTQMAHSQVIGHATTQQPLSLSIVLPLRNETALQQYIQGLYTSGSYLYHRYLRPTDFAALYGPAPQDVQRVSAYLQSQGFQITHTDGQIIDFSGSVPLTERAFQVQINRYHANDGHTFYANTSAPFVPQALRPLIQHIYGLNNALQRQQPPLHAQPLAIKSRVQRIASNVTCPGVGTNYYTPSQLATAYDFTGLYNAGYHGEGQRVALFELDGYTPSDVSSYQSCFDANSPTQIATNLIDGGPGTTGAGGLEVELDMEVLLGMLPKLSNLSVYEAPNTSTGYNDEWARILHDDIPIVSTSWGTCEANLSQADITTENQFLMQAAAQGQSVLAASGDSAAYDCGSGTSSLAVDDPASNPYVTGVGGTHLALNSNGTYNSESAWSNSPSYGNGSGGGVSQLWSMPSYQSGPGVVSNYSSGSPCQAAAGKYCREVPDVSLNADPNTGYMVYCTIAAASCPTSSFVRVGGTSAAAPMWAAITALTNQYALANSETALGFLNPTLYALLNSSSLYGRAFHDVTSGTNLYYPATTGYDMVTGAGSADAYGFALAATSLSGSPVIPGSTRWYFAEGHVGNHFQEYLTLENPSASSVAHVTVNYLLRGRPALSQSLSLNPGTRSTVNVNVFLGVDKFSTVGQDVSLFISSDNPIVAERPMYFIFGGVTTGGSDIVGATQLGQHFSFANGETVNGYSTFLSILNPAGQPQATVTASYYSGGSLIGKTTITVPAGQRNTIPVNGVLAGGKQFLIQVDSDQPIAVERPLYFHINVPGIPGTVVGGSTVQGMAPTTSWYFPDGNTGGQGTPSQENLILANPDIANTGASASISVLYALGNGGTKTVTLSVPAKSQLIEHVNGDVGYGGLVSMKVVSTNGVGIVAERQQFFSFPSLTPNATGVEVTGATPTSNGLPTAYSFAEGHLGSSFSEYVTLFNPNNSVVRTSITYFVTNGTRQYLAQQQVSVPAMGITQVNVNNFLNVPSSATTASGVAVDVSMVVQALPESNGSIAPIVAERSLYFNFGGIMPGSTSVVGYGGA